MLFRRWSRLEIDRIISEVTASLTVADNEGYINIAELCQLVGRELFFGDYESEAHGALNILSSYIKYRKICKRTLGTNISKY